MSHQLEYNQSQQIYPQGGLIDIQYGNKKHQDVAAGKSGERKEDKNIKRTRGREGRRRDGGTKKVGWGEEMERQGINRGGRKW